MRNLTRSSIAALAANMAVAAFGAMPSGAMTHHAPSMLAEIDVLQAKPVEALPLTGLQAGVSESNARTIIKVAGGRNSGARRTTKRTGSTLKRRAGTHSTAQSGNSTLSTRQGGGTQAQDGTFDSQDLIQAFSAGGYNK